MTFIFQNLLLSLSVKEFVNIWPSYVQE